MKKLSCGLAVLFVLQLFPVSAGILDPKFKQAVWLTNTAIANNSGFDWAPDGSNRLFIIQQPGVVRVVKNGVLQPTPFATISPIYNQVECGLLGIAFDPSFASNKYVYFFVSVSSTEQQIIRYTDTNSIGTSKTIIVHGLPTQGANHDGGSLGIGHDGKLYWAIGDNGGTRFGVDNDLTLLAAKVGRANRNGTVPTDNPFRDGTGPHNDYIWARGFRNPFTMRFQPDTGRLFVNTVGELYEQMFVVTKAANAGWDNYENNQPPGYLSPLITYPTNTTDTAAIGTGGASRVAHVATFDTTAPHRLRQGGKVIISGVADASFNGTYFVASVPSETRFTVNQTPGNASSGGGQAMTEYQGGCITGGDFWDSSSVPRGYRGNFMYGDFNAGFAMRALLDTAGHVLSVTRFIDGVSGMVDQAVGPDGALYSLGVSENRIFRTEFTSTAQGLVVTPLHPLLDEGGRTAVNVRLAQKPTGNVIVSIQRSAGDSSLNVFGQATLTFTPTNYATPQAFLLSASEDSNALNNVAQFSVTSTGLPTQIVSAKAIDNDSADILLSASSLPMNEGTRASFTVRLAAKPTGNVVVTAKRSYGDTDITVVGGATLVFSPTNYATPQPVTINAAEDADSTNDSASIFVSAPGLAPITIQAIVTDND